jgi:hypothetical protein
MVREGKEEREGGGEERRGGEKGGGEEKRLEYFTTRNTVVIYLILLVVFILFIIRFSEAFVVAYPLCITSSTRPADIPTETTAAPPCTAALMVPTLNTASVIAVL